MNPKNIETKESAQVRPPIVVIVGHIDHGKTTILDWLRKTKVAEKESGGITQHIGAYIIEHTPTNTGEKKYITFIDTPGHEAFSKLRSRGATIADIAVLVIAAEEGVKPQTKEALEIIQKAQIPFLVAINKIDKKEANPERVKQDLAKENILVESYGGQIPSVEVSGKTGQNMDEFLEVILLMAEIEHLGADPTKAAEGFVLEAHRDPRRGINATLLIRDGTLHSGDFTILNGQMESIRIFENFLGKPIKEAGPSSPVLIAGLKEMPLVGDPFKGFSNRNEAETFAKTQEKKESSQKKAGEKPEEGKRIFSIIIKADVTGSLEALEELLGRFQSDQASIQILKSETGDINESDVKLARATSRVTIVGFRVGIDSSVRQLGEVSNIRIITGDVIYDLVDNVKKQIEDFIPPIVTRTELGKARVVKLFKKEGGRQVLGGRVLEGELRAGATFEIVRANNNVGRGTIAQVQHNKIDTPSVDAGKEFGALIDFRGTVEENDTLILFLEETTRKTF